MNNSGGELPGWVVFWIIVLMVVAVVATIANVIHRWG